MAFDAKSRQVAAGRTTDRHIFVTVVWLDYHDTKYEA